MRVLSTENHGQSTASVDRIAQEDGLSVPAMDVPCNVFGRFAVCLFLLFSNCGTPISTTQVTRRFTSQFDIIYNSYEDARQRCTERKGLKCAAIGGHACAVHLCRARLDVLLLNKTSCLPISSTCRKYTTCYQAVYETWVYCTGIATVSRVCINSTCTLTCKHLFLQRFLCEDLLNTKSNMNV